MNTTWLATILMATAALCACSPDPTPTTAPPLPDLEAPQRACQTHGNPTHRGHYCMAQARARMTSYPFSPARGPEALAWLGEAAACFGEAQEPTAQARATRLRAGFGARLDGDMRTEQLRLEHALSQRETADQRRAARYLLALLASQRGSPYVRWLERLARGLP